MKSDKKKIEQYLAGELVGAEKLDFENRLKADKILLKELELYKNVNEAISESDIMELRESLTSIMNQEKKNAGLLSRVSFYWQMAAAVMLMLIIVKFVFFNNQPKEGNITLFNKYYQLYQPLQPVRDGLQNKKTVILYNQAIVNYENKEFLKAESLLTQIINRDSTETMARFYLAMAQIETEHNNEALRNLEILTLNADHLFYEQSMWYKALVNLRQKNEAQSRKILNFIIENKFYNFEKAEHLMKEMN